MFNIHESEHGVHDRHSSLIIVFQMQVRCLSEVSQNSVGKPQWHRGNLKAPGFDPELSLLSERSFMFPPGFMFASHLQKHASSWSV